MAELLKCNLCGYETVRSGMTNHLKGKHPLDYIGTPFEKLVTSLGKIRYSGDLQTWLKQGRGEQK